MSVRDAERDVPPYWRGRDENGAGLGSPCSPWGGDI